MAKADTSKQKRAVKLTRQKAGPVISVSDFLALKKPKGDMVLQVAKEQVSLTSLDRIYWPEQKLTKFDLLCFYLKVADSILPFLTQRPAILQRWPRGVNAPMFFQQDLESAPVFVKTIRLTNLEGRELDYAVFSTTASLLHFVNLGTIEQHPWHSTTKHLNKPDWMAIDLDPKQAPWENVLEVALVVKQVADEIGITAFPKTSGSSGIHVYVPLKPSTEYEKVAEFARLLAGEVVRRVPKIATVERSLAKRKREQVYVDFMQNARGKSLAAVLTARAKPKATVSMPLTWNQIQRGMKITDFTITNVPELITANGNAWANFFEQRQTLKLR
ncbi:MAG: non-homologous end-joining DNA ligase [Pyrinomonadaceae bacterium]